jgi:hypothetical protein
MVSIILITALNQTNRFRDRIDNLVSVYSRAALVQQQLNGDISALFVPLQAEAPEKAQEKPEEPRQAEPARPVAEKPKVLEKVFYATQKNNNLDQLTFITTNAMQIHWGTAIGKPKPRMVRVIYRLIPDAKIAKSFILTRQEGSDLDIDNYKEGNPKAPRVYAVIDGIKEMTVEYSAPLVESSQAEEREVDSRLVGEKKLEYKTVKEWDYAKIQEQDKWLPKIPTTIRIRLVLWDALYKRSTSFIFTPIILSNTEKSRSMEEKKPAPKPAEKPVQTVSNKKSPVLRSSSTLKMTTLTMRGQ